MLKIVEHEAPSRAPAYAVPWSVDRSDPLHPIIVNDSAHDTVLVRVLVHSGTTHTRIEMWGTIRPGDHRTLCLCETDLDTMVATVLWFLEAWGQEYAWPFVM